MTEASEDPKRFFALKDDGTILIKSHDPQEVQAAAEEYAADNPHEAVHLYQHVLTLKRSPDGA